MADVDDFDSLSNAELRAKMLAQGLPNIPVTDSSRKVLVKRLRASIGGQGSPAPTASPKKSNKRDTLAAAAPVPSAPAAASTPVDKLDGNKIAPATKARRTITATEAKEAERRRPEEPVVARKPTTAAAAPPIQTRRTSTTSTGPERKVLEPIRKPQIIAEEPAASKRADPEEKYLKVNSLIVLESDDEEDEQLAEAANLVEQQQAARTSKFTTSGTTSYEYKSKVVEPPRRQVYEATAAPVLPSYVPSARTQTTSSTRSYEYGSNQAAAPGRYSSFVRTAAQGYVTAEAPPISAYSSSSYQRTYANELSDDNDADDAQYESTFAQNLARLRAEKIGDRCSPYRRTLASGNVASGSLGYEPRARRSLRPDENSVSVAFARWWNSLEQKYHIKSKLFILFVILLLIGVYSVFF
ncbi:otefin [Drosophila eugracilis]|uniref:otefin n=1 Tax=Drosophila eugracilis TaxID=29029 RepID=UPI0007E83A75|nr:otefin [Drosophila eugracilis]